MTIFEHLSSTPVGDRYTRLLTFLYQTGSLTTFIWSIFWYNAYFWQRRVLKWIYYVVFVHFNILKIAICKNPAPLLWEIDICAHWLFYKKSLTTLIWSIFWYNGYFWQLRVLKWINLAIFVRLNIWKMAILGAPYLISKGNKHMRPLTFLPN